MNRSALPSPGPFTAPAVAALSLVALLAASGCNGSSSSAEIPDEVVRQNIFGTAYLGQQKWKEAEQAFRAAIALRPDDPLLLNNAAVALQQQSRIDEARELLERAVALDPDYPYAHYNLGLIDKQAGDFESAAAHFEAVAAYDPDDLLTQYNLGIVLSRIGRDDDAEQAFRNALARDPNHVSSLYGLGRYLMQKGEQEEGARMIALSQEIRQRSGLDTAVGLQYGEQGPYAMGVDYDGSTLHAPEPIAVTFDDVARSGGALRGCLGTRLAGDPALLCFGETGVERLEPDGAKEVLALPRDGSTPVALAAGDVDGDAVVELAALVADDGEARLRLAVQGGDGLRWDDAARFGGWRFSGRPSAAHMIFVDLDHDGDLDLFACLAAPGGGDCVLATNDGAGGFAVSASDAHGFTASPSAGPVQVGFSDVDNDRDIDLFVALPGRFVFLSNRRDGTFHDVAEASGLDAAAIAPGSVALADLDKDGWMDLVSTGDAGVEWRRNRNGGFEAAVQVGNGAPHGLAVIDFDNDGFLDLATGGTLFRNEGAGGWARIETGHPGADRTVLLAMDVDRDGDLDLAARGDDGKVSLLSNEGGNARSWIVVDSRGVGDNSFGVGAKVEVLAGSLRQKFEVVDAVPLHVGLGDRERVESVRHLWPSGVLQDEIDLPAGGSSEITQLDRKGTSCPLLYAWRGGEWRFVTDFLGGAAIGYRHADGSYSVPDTDEYVLVEDGLEALDGRLRLRVNNQLEEVIWFDKLELVVVDHPRGTQIYPDERLMPEPPFPPFRLFASGDVRPVAGARQVERDTDAASLLAARDGRFVEGFALLPYKGYAQRHTLELDLGRLPERGRVVLLLDGWIDYADSTANVAASQAGAVLEPPRLTVSDGAGGWRETGHRMGFPAGLPKTMAVDLTDLLTRSDPRVRIATTMRIYWDRARVMVGGEDTPVSVRRLRPQRAELRFGGFPRPVGPPGPTPRAYDPQQVDGVATWKAHVGAYTAFGDVTGTVAEIDDRLVTTRNGDEIELTFVAPPPPAPDVERSFLLFADGFGKDMDPNSAASERVGPVPFHGMPTYPYGAQVTPPHEPAPGPARTVFESPRGWPGAPPQPLAGLDVGPGDETAPGGS